MISQFVHLFFILSSLISFTIICSMAKSVCWYSWLIKDYSNRDKNLQKMLTVTISLKAIRNLTRRPHFETGKPPHKINVLWTYQANKPNSTYIAFSFRRTKLIAFSFIRKTRIYKRYYQIKSTWIETVTFERLFVMTRLSFKVSASKYCSYKKEFNIDLASLGKTFFSLNVLQIQMINFKEKEIWRTISWYVRSN